MTTTAPRPHPTPKRPGLRRRSALLGLVAAICTWATACGSEHDPADSWRVTAELPSMHDSVGSLTSAGGYLWFRSHHGLMVFDPDGDCDDLCHIRTDAGRSATAPANG